MDIVEEIKKLKALLDQGAISEEEFSVLKRKLMSNETYSNEPQKLSPVSSQSDPDKIINGTNEESPIVKESVKKEVKFNEFQEPNAGTIRMVKVCIGLGLLLGVIFWYRYDSFIAFLITAGASIGLTFIIARLILKLIPRNVILVVEIILLSLLIIIPIGNVTNTSSSSSSESSSSGDNRTCDWCGKSYTGNGYFHLGTECVVGNKNLGAGNMCSTKCCMDSWNATHR